MKACPFGPGNELTIAQARPATLACGFDFVSTQHVPQRCGSALIEQDAHSGSCQRTACGVVQDRAGLFQGDSREPLNELMDASVVFEVLEEGSDRNPRAAKDPDAADAVRVTLDGRA